MKITGMTRLVLQAVMTAGVNGVLENIIKTTMPIDAKVAKKIFDKIGEYAITAAIAGIVSERAISEIEEILSIAFPEPEVCLDALKPSEQMAKDIIHAGEQWRAGGISSEEAIKRMHEAAYILHQKEPNGQPKEQ